MKNIVLFASGNGSNAEEIINYFKNSENAKVVAIFSNKADAKVLDRAKNHNIPSVVFSKAQLNEGFVLEKLQQFQPDLIVLAGFLWKFPSRLLSQFPHVINVHPALLPKFGGKGFSPTTQNRLNPMLREIAPKDNRSQSFWFELWINGC
mgnify:CR=1 FL=1